MNLLHAPSNNNLGSAVHFQLLKSIAAACLLLAVVLLLPPAPDAAREPRRSPYGNPILTLRLNQTVVQAEVVSSPDKLHLGLGGRRSLAPGTGMLFIMPELARQEFCMRGMLIPIDIIWIAHNRIIGFHQHLSPQDPGLFASPEPADLVLEVPAGFVAAQRLRVGDPLTFPGRQVR